MLQRLFSYIMEIGIKNTIELCRLNNDNANEIMNFLKDSSVIHNDDQKKQIRKVIMSIDIEGNLFNLPEELQFDLAITHHPLGKAQYAYPNVFNLYKYIFGGYIQNNKSGKLNQLLDLGVIRLKNYSYSVNAFSNSYLWSKQKMSIICVHTIADICTNNFLNKLLLNKNSLKLNDLIILLNSIPEVKIYNTENIYPYIVLGNPTDECGNILVDMLNGVVEVPEFLEYIFESGINTIITMHVSDDYLKEAKKYKLNLINLGHIPADNIGMNIISREIYKKFNFEIFDSGGFKSIL